MKRLRIVSGIGSANKKSPRKRGLDANGRNSYIQLCSPYIGSHKTLNSYRKKQKGKKQTNQSFTALSTHSQPLGLHLTDIYMNSLQSQFLHAKHLCRSQHVHGGPKQT